MAGTRVHQAHISWFPNTMFDDGRDRNKHAQPILDLQHRTARPAFSYAVDKSVETGATAARRYLSQTAYDSALAEAREVWALLTNPDPANRLAAHMRDDFVEMQLDDVEVALREREGKSIPGDERARLEFKRDHLLAIRAAIGDPTLGTPPAYPPLDAAQRFEPRTGQKGSGGRLVTSAAQKECVPGVAAIAHYQHVRGDQILPKAVDPVVLAAANQRFPQGRPALWGLNLHAILEHWITFVSNPRHGYQYASTRHNCAGVVFGALKAGGVGAYVSTELGWLGEELLYVTPREVHEVVKSLMECLEFMNAETRSFMDAVGAGPGRTLFDTVDLVNGDLWSARNFAEESRSPNKFARRHEQVGKIDKALAAYHRAGPAFTPQNFEAKLNYLMQMMVYVCEHRREKPRSDRRRGVDSLGVQICKLLLADPIEAMYPERLESLIGRANDETRRKIEQVSG